MLISKNTPLISNLNMIENIALIQEVHEHLPTPIAQSNAKAALAKISLLHIADNRSHQCSSKELFYVMLIRAVMMQESNIVIVTPFILIDELESITELYKPILDLLDAYKKVIFLDLQNNKIHYEGLE